MRTVDFHRHWFVRLGLFSTVLGLASTTIASRADAQLADQAVVSQAGVMPTVTTGPGVSQVRQPTDTNADPRPADSPIIKFDLPHYNFGRILAGTRVGHDFRFTNAGNQPLMITNVKPSCGCATAGPYEKTIAPGETGKIPISMNTRSLGGKTHKAVIVTTNDPWRPRVHLRLTGEIVPPLKVDPPSASFGTLQDDVQQQRVLKIVNNMEEMLEITNIKNNSVKFETELKTLKPGREFELTVTALPPFEPGYLQDAIFLETNLPEMRLSTIGVNGYRASAVEVSPTLVSLPSPIAGDFRRQIFVRHTQQHPLKLTDLKVSGEELKLSLKEASPAGKAYWIILAASTGYRLPKAGEHITFKTDDPSTPRVTIPIVRDRSRVFAKGLAAPKRLTNRSDTLLTFANTLLSKGNHQNGVKWLSRIIEQYPKSDAANEAKQLLDEVTR